MAGQQFARSNYDGETTAEWMARRQRIVDERRATTPNGGFLKPDASAPACNPVLPRERYQMELKPDTPSGRAAAARAVRKYEELTGNKTRAIYYKRKN